MILRFAGGVYASRPCRRCCADGGDIRTSCSSSSRRLAQQPRQRGPLRAGRAGRESPPMPRRTTVSTRHSQVLRAWCTGRCRVRCMAADATIKVTSQTRDRLAELAKEQGLSIGGLLELLTQQHPSQAQIDAERERTRAALAARGYDPSPDDREQLRQRFETKLAAIQRQEADILARTMQTSA